MSLQRAVAQLRARELGLTDWVVERDAVSQEFERLQNERNAAIRALARGDGTQRKTIISLEQQMKPLSDRLEGLTGLVSEAEEAVAQARGILLEAQAQEQAEMEAYVQAREGEAVEAICAGAPERKQRIYDLYIELCQEIAQLNLAASRVSGHEAANQAVEQALRTLPMQIASMVREAGWRSFYATGFLAGDLMVWPMVKIPPELAHEFPGGLVNVKDLSAALKAQDRERLSQEFKKIKSQEVSP